MDELHPDWAPTLHLGHCELQAMPSDLYGHRWQSQHKSMSEEEDQDEPKQQKVDGEENNKSQPVKRKSKMVMISKRSLRKRKSCVSQHRSNNNHNTDRDGFPHQEDSLSEQAFRAELLELLSGTVTHIQQHQRAWRGLQHDHSTLSFPSDPARLTHLLSSLIKEKRHEEQVFLNLRQSLQAKENLLQESKMKWEKAQQSCHDKIRLLTIQLNQEEEEKQLLKREIKGVKEQLAVSNNTILHLSLEQKQSLQTRQPKLKLKSRQPTVSARALSRGPPQWVRFFTGFKTYAHFETFLAFLHSGDGNLLTCFLDNEKEGADRIDNEKDDTDSRSKENGPTSDMDAIDQDSTSLTQSDNPTVFLEEDDSDEEEATPESVRENLMAQIPGRWQRMSACRALSPADELLLTLMRLRLGLLVQDLALRFQIGHATVYRVWTNIMALMQHRLQLIPVRGSQHYISRFRPQHSLHLGPGRELIVLECTDLLFDNTRRDRSTLVERKKQPGGSRTTRKSKKSPKSTAAGASKPSSSSLLLRPYRYLQTQRGCVLASPEGHLGFCSASRFQDWEDWAAEPEGAKPDALPALPPYLVGDEKGQVPVPAEGIPHLQVLSVCALTDRVHSFRFLQMVHCPVEGTIAQLDRAWEVSCYLTCLQRSQLGLNMERHVARLMD